MKLISTPFKPLVCYINHISHLFPNKVGSTKLNKINKRRWWVGLLLFFLFMWILLIIFFIIYKSIFFISKEEYRGWSGFYSIPLTHCDGIHQIMFTSPSPNLRHCGPWGKIWLTNLQVNCVLWIWNMYWATKDREIDILCIKKYIND